MKIFLSWLGKNTLVDYIKLGAACVSCWQLLILGKEFNNTKLFLRKIPIKKFLEHPLEAYE